MANEFDSLCRSLYDTQLGSVSGLKNEFLHTAR